MNRHLSRTCLVVLVMAGALVAAPPSLVGAAPPRASGGPESGHWVARVIWSDGVIHYQQWELVRAGVLVSISMEEIGVGGNWGVGLSLGALVVVVVPTDPTVPLFSGLVEEDGHHMAGGVWRLNGGEAGSWAADWYY